MNYLPEPKGGWALPVSIDLSDKEKDFFRTDFRRIVDELGPGMDIPETETENVKGEWQDGVNIEGIEKLDDEERLSIMAERSKSGPVILSLHGGGYVTGNAAME